jgi:DNA modification methylase
MSDFRVIVGDCVEGMHTLPDQSVHTCVTSPPYFGLRDYGMAGQIGLEDTPDAFVARLVDVFREVKRVLRDDGTLWLNLGDSYSTHAAGKVANPMAKSTLAGVKTQAVANESSRARGDYYRTPGGLPEKNLLGIPWRVAFALQADGWYLRQDIIWHKPNPMPESVTDRCTKAHEYLFLLSKSDRYFFDAGAIKEPTSDNEVTRARNNRSDKGIVGPADLHGTGFGQSGRGGWQRAGIETRNRRSVWTVTTKPYAGAHFATFPPDLIEPCVLAGCPVGGTVLDPFGGSGTTAGVALRNGRNAILCELNPEYAALMPDRVSALGGNQPDLFRSAAE